MAKFARRKLPGMLTGGTGKLKLAHRTKTLLPKASALPCRMKPTQTKLPKPSALPCRMKQTKPAKAQREGNERPGSVSKLQLASSFH